MGGLTKGLKQIASDIVQFLGKDKGHRGSKRDGRTASEHHISKSRSARHSSGLSSSQPHASLPQIPAPACGATLFRDALSDNGAQPTTSQLTQAAPTALQQRHKGLPITSFTSQCDNDGLSDLSAAALPASGVSCCCQPPKQQHPVSAPAAPTSSGPCSSLCCSLPLTPTSAPTSGDGPTSAATDASVASEWWATNCASAVPEAASAQASNPAPDSTPQACPAPAQPVPIIISLELCNSGKVEPPVAAADDGAAACPAAQTPQDATSESSHGTSLHCKGGCRPTPKVGQVYTSPNLPAAMRRNVPSWSSSDFDVSRVMK